MRSISDRLLIAVCGVFFALPSALPQAPQPNFEIAAIKLSKDLTGNNFGIATGRGKLSARDVTLKECIIAAYGVGPHQVIGGPSWIDTTRFDIEAKGDPEIDNDDTFMEMLQRLLNTRFGLSIHHDQKTMHAYSLEVASAGLKIEPVGDGEPITNSYTTSTSKTLDAGHVSFARLAHVLAREAPLPIVDHTGLDGLYTFQLRWTPDDARQPESQAEDYGSLPDALREQLGLQLRAATIPVDAIVIESVTKPTDN